MPFDINSQASKPGTFGVAFEIVNACIVKEAGKSKFVVSSSSEGFLFVDTCCASWSRTETTVNFNVSRYSETTCIWLGVNPDHKLQYISSA